MPPLAFIAGTLAGIQPVYLTILLIFFVLVLLSWWVASRDWFKDEIVAAERGNQQVDQPDDSQ